MNRSEFDFLCRQTRHDIVEMFINFKGGHLASALSLVETLVTLFYFEMKSKDDRFVLSKGHGCLALYAILGNLGYFPKDEWKKIGTPEGILGGHPTSGTIPGVEISSGSLGLSPSVAVGLALAARLQGRTSRTFCVLGDGECNEGSVWEAALSASQHKLNHLFFLIDCNGYQAYGKTEEVWNLEPLRGKWEAFGFSVFDIDLQANRDGLFSVFDDPSLNSEKPKAILCRTSKGMGIPAIENNPAWHNKGSLSLDEIQLLRESVAL